MRRTVCDLCGHDTPDRSIVTLNRPVTLESISIPPDLDWDICMTCASQRLVPWLEENRWRGDPPRTSHPRTLHG